MEGRFKKVLKILNITQKEIAEVCDILQPTVSDWVNDKREIPERNLKRLVETFNINPEYIRDGIGDPINKNRNSILQNNISILSEPESKYSNPNEKIDALIATIISQQDTINILSQKIKTLEDEQELLRQQKLNYRKTPTINEQNKLHNKKLTPMIGKRFTPK